MMPLYIPSHNTKCTLINHANSLRRQWYACLAKAKPDMSDVLPQWRDNIDAFAEAMHCLGWLPGHTIERISANLPLEPRNLHFVPASAHIQRRSNTKYVFGFGIMAPLAWFIQEHPLCKIRDYHVVYGRIASGWSAEEAMMRDSNGRNKPAYGAYSPNSAIQHDGQTVSLSQIAKDNPHDLTTKDLVKRLNLGWSLDQAIDTPLNGVRPPRH